MIKKVCKEYIIKNQRFMKCKIYQFINYKDYVIIYWWIHTDILYIYLLEIN